MYGFWVDPAGRRIATLALCLSLFTACSGKKTQTSSAIPADRDNSYTPNFMDDMKDGLQASTPDPITPLEEKGLENLVQSQASLNPLEDADVPPELMERMKALVAKQAQDAEEAAQLNIERLLLFGELMKRCAAEVALLTPQPGETHIGDWGVPNGTPAQNRTCSFEVSARYANGAASGGTVAHTSVTHHNANSTNYQIDVVHRGPHGLPEGPAQFAVTLKTKRPKTVPFRATPDGKGTFPINKGRKQVTLIDQPRAGHGDPKNPPCFRKVQLLNTRNPIPFKFTEAVKRYRQCAAKGLFLMSPAFPLLKKQLPPQLAGLIFSRMLGVQ